ncbi:hypothetical protein SAMN04487895_106353 [Paenibacillus sophorae]|uniref:Uncharacterized protein n=1 Tax=Paenibacillus sophorae TaxID=1333845 RepID=A0A1H8NPX0_9BACL|nr:hypothetical protein [Paenibacillus sophorae]QWU14512.1 hypothetical protein KP014_21650 [Paenibacillus sophorae]SEO31652.1 hypothetical protein SAMN04487895_106353 [Paenibacillus sophorae]
MKPIIRKEIRDYIKFIIKNQNNQIREFDRHKELVISNNEIMNTIYYISKINNETHKVIYKHFSDELALSYTGIACLSYLSIAVYQEDCNNPINKHWFAEKGVDPSFVLQTQLINITNHALSIVN